LAILLWISDITVGTDCGCLRRIFGPKRAEVTGGWMKLHNEEFHNVLFANYNQNDHVKMCEMGRIASMHGREEKCTSDFGGKARRKKTTRNA
jgi:hypothetical protein